MEDGETAEGSVTTVRRPGRRSWFPHILAMRPIVVHPQSGNGQADIALVQSGAREVIGVHYSETTVRVAQSRADNATDRGGSRTAGSLAARTCSRHRPPLHAYCDHLGLTPERDIDGFECT
jgi:hypothetical protein